MTGLFHKVCLRRIILLLSPVLVAGCVGQTGPDQPAVPSVTPFPTAAAVARETYVVQRGNVVEELTFTGRWEPRDQLQLAFDVDGTVRRVNVRRGDTVSVGDVLADLDIEELEDQLEDQQIALEDALADAEEGSQSEQEAVESAQLEVFNARLALQRLRETPPTGSMRGAVRGIEDAERAVQDAEEAYRAALASASQAQGSAAGVDSAYEGLIQARRGLEDARYSYAESAAGAGEAIEQYNQQMIDAENNVILAERNLQEALQGDSGSTSSRTIRDIQTNITRLQEDIARSTLSASIEGVVLEVQIQPGDNVQAFQTVITIGVPEPREVIASIPIAQVQRIGVGLIGVCNVINRDDSMVQCRVRQLPVSARDADQTTRIAASLEDFADAGAIIEVSMPLQVRENVLFLPPGPIREFQGQPFVLLETPDGPRRTFVELGLQTQDRVEIVSGLNEGDVVIGR